MREADADVIVREWTERSGAEPPALHAFLVETLPDVEAWAVRKPGPVEPQLLAISADHLHRVSSAEVDGHRALGLERWALRDVTLAVHEWDAGGARRRRWTLRMREDAFTLDTEQPEGEEPPALERLLRLVLERSR